MLVKDLPEIFQLEVTSVCNMRCGFCPHPMMKRKKEHMSMEVFFRASTYFVPYQTLGLYMMGDPLLHPNLLEMISFARYKGCKPEIATNSLGFKGDKAFAASVLLSGLEYIILDMSRWKERPEVMDRAFSNIQMVCEVYEKLRQPLPTLAFQIVTHPKNPQDFPEWVKAFAARNPKKGLLKRKFLDTWAGQMKELYDYTDVVAPPTRTPCHEPFERVAVLENGDVVPCCRDAEGLIVYGNIMKQPLREIWHSPTVENVRQKMLAAQNDSLPEPCRSCKEWAIPMNRHLATQEGKDEWSSND